VYLAVPDGGLCEMSLRELNREGGSGTHVRVRPFTLTLEHLAPGEHARLATVEPVDVPDILGR